MMPRALIRIGVLWLLIAPASAATRADIGADGALRDREAAPAEIDLTPMPEPGRRPLSGSTATNIAPRATSERGNPLWSIPLSKLSSTRDRPLFSASRRPPPRAVAAVPVVETVAPPPPPAPPEIPRLALVGAVGNGTQSVAMFVDLATSNVVSVKIGENHAGWVLRQVKGREALLEKDDRPLWLSLPQAGEQSPGSPPAQLPLTASLPGVTGTVPGLQGGKSADPARPPLPVPLVTSAPTGRVPGL